jgi:hypothetical protein
MGKATVLNCDKCNVWDSEETPVVRVPVVGAKFELCQPCRVKILCDLGVAPLAAARFIESLDEPRDGAGRPVSLATITRQIKAEARTAEKNGNSGDASIPVAVTPEGENGDTPAQTGNTPGQDVVNDQPEPDTQVSQPAARKRATAKK